MRFLSLFFPCASPCLFLQPVCRPLCDGRALVPPFSAQSLPAQDTHGCGRNHKGKRKDKEGRCKVFVFFPLAPLLVPVRTTCAERPETQSFPFLAESRERAREVTHPPSNRTAVRGRQAGEREELKSVSSSFRPTCTLSHSHTTPR